MATGAERLLARAKAFEKASGPGGPLAALSDFFGVAEASLKSAFIAQRVAKRPEMIALIRSILENGWSRSRLNRNSKSGHGRLYQAAVKDAVITATSKGIVVSMAAGLDEKMYAWAGAMLYGAVHGPREVREVRDTVTGQLNHAASQVARSVLGARAKRSIKKAAFAGVALSDRARKRIETDSNAKGHTQRRGVSLGSVHVRAPHKFWNFSNDEYEAVSDLWLQLLGEEVADVLKKHKAMRVKMGAVSA